MCSLVEIKTHDEIYIHYLSDEDVTSDRGDSIDSSEVTINNCVVDAKEKLLVTSSDIAVQTDVMDNEKQHKEKLKKKCRNKAVFGNINLCHALTLST